MHCAGWKAFVRDVWSGRINRLEAVVAGVIVFNVTIVGSPNACAGWKAFVRDVWSGRIQRYACAGELHCRRLRARGPEVRDQPCVIHRTSPGADAA